MTKTHKYLPIALWSLVYLCVIGGLQLFSTYPFDNDTAYHAAVGGLIRKYGILHTFPWTTFSVMADRYADKELLFHLLFVPLVGLDFVTASRIVGTVGGTGVLLTVYLILRKEGVRYAGLWALAPLTASGFYVYRLALVRPHLISITLALLLLWAAVRCRYWTVAIVAVIYPLAYVAFWQIPLLLLCAVETGRFLSGQTFRWKTSAVAVAGILIGVAVHPNAQNLLQLNWAQMSVLINAWQMKEGFDLGGEFTPPPLNIWMIHILPLVIMVGISIAVALYNRTRDTLLIACLIAAIAFGILTARTIRFVEYFAPFAAASLALASRQIPYRYFSHAILIVSLISTTLFGRMEIIKLAMRPHNMPNNVDAALRQLIPPGAQVFTPDWQCTGVYMLALPERRFVVALDPTFFYLKDPELYKVWYSISRKAPADTVDIIRNRFRSRYVLFFHLAFWDQFGPLFNRLLTDSRVKTLYRNEGIALFDIGEANGLPVSWGEQIPDRKELTRK